MSAPPRYTTMLDSVPPAAPPQMSSLVGSEYELLSLRQELERLRRENGRYKEEVFDLKAVALMQQQEARSEAALKLKSIESEMTFKEKNFQDMNRKYVSIKRDLALQKQEIKQLKDKVSEAAAKASGSSGASSQTTAGAAAAKRGEELQHTIDRLQRQLSERVQSTALSTANGSSSSSSRRSNRLLDDQALTQLASRCYEVLVALLLRCQDLPQQDAAAAKPRDPEGSLAAVEGSAEVVYAEIEQAFVALQVMLSSPSGADESSLLNLCSVAASVVFLAHSCHQHAPCWLANTMEPADGASPDHSLAPALCSSQQQDGSYTALNSTRTPSLLSMAADRPGSAGTVLRRARDRGDKKEWAAAEPLPLLLRFLTRLLSTIIAAINSHIMPRAERSAAEGAVDLADRFDDASPDGPGNSAVKKRKTEGRCHGAPLASLVLPAAAAGALDDAYTAARDNANTILGSDRPAPMLDVYQDLLALVVSLAKQLLAHRSASPNLKGVPQLPPPLQQEVDEAAVELLLLLLPSSAAEGLISSDFIASKLLRKGADQSAPFLLSLFSDVDAVASNAPGLAAVAALSSLRVQTRLLQYLEQLLTDPGIFNCFCICQMRGEQGSGNRGKKSSPADTERAAPPGTEPTSFCALLSQLAERYSQAAHWPSALSCDTDCDPGGRAVSEAKRVFALNAMRLLLRLVRRHGAAGVLALLGECGGAGAAADLSLALQQTPRDPSAVNAIIVVAASCTRQLDGDWGSAEEGAAELLACAVQLLSAVCRVASLQGFNNITTSESSQLVNGLLYRWCYGFCHARLAQLAEPLTVFYADSASEPSPDWP